MSQLHSQASILWRQVWGLSAMLAAILISFKAYELYQPSILTDLGYAPLVSSLGVIQGVLGMVVEPLVGGFSDRILRQFGSRLPQITIGITLAGLIFIIVALMTQSSLWQGIRGLVPGLMLVWLIAMIAVRGPILAMLRQFAPVEELPHANALIILVLGLVGASSPLLEMGLKQIGSSPTFVLGAIALMVGAALLFASTPRHTIMPFLQAERNRATVQHLGRIFLVGVGASLQMGLLMAVFTKLLNAQLPILRIEWITAAILLISAISANPFSKLTTHLGAVRAMQLGLGTLVALMGLILINQSSFLAPGLILACGLTMGLLFISIIPFALSGVPLSQAGLSTGLYFGGSGLAGAIAAILLRQSQAISPVMAFAWALGSCLITVLCLKATQRSPAYG